MCVGNLPGYLPVILDEMRTQPKKQYMLLHALKDVIQFEARTPQGLASLNVCLCLMTPSPASRPVRSFLFRLQCYLLALVHILIVGFILSTF